MNARVIINQHIWKLASMHQQCAQRHAAAMVPISGEKTQEKAIAMILEGLAIYAEAHQARFDSNLGDDGVLGKEWLEMARGFVGLLNGELGRLDGGTLDATIRDVAKEAGFEEEL